MVCKKKKKRRPCNHEGSYKREAVRIRKNWRMHLADFGNGARIHEPRKQVTSEIWKGQEADYPLEL